MTEITDASIEGLARIPKSPLALANPVKEFDGRAMLFEGGGLVRVQDGTLHEAAHLYVVDGEVGWISATTVVKQWIEPFDAPAVARLTVRSPRWERSEYRRAADAFATAQMRARWTAPDLFTGDTIGLSEETREAAKKFRDGVISWDSLIASSNIPSSHLRKWEDRYADACVTAVQKEWNLRADLGTKMHARIEDFFEHTMSEEKRKSLEGLGEPELLQFLAWVDEWLAPRGLRPFRVELRVFCPRLRLAGSIDALFIHPDRPGELVMVDWKRSRDVSETAYRGKECTGPLAGMPDCKFTHYAMQQNMYKFFLETYTSYRVVEMFLLVCHPNQARFQLMPVPTLAERVRALCDARAAQLAAK